jgi:Predicted transcriptional regulator
MENIIIRRMKRKVTFTIVPNSVIDNGGLNPNELAMYVIILRLQGDSDKAVSVSLNKLAETLKISRPTVIKTLDSLINQGFIEKQTANRADGGSDSNTYKVIGE